MKQVVIFIILSLVYFFVSKVVFGSKLSYSMIGSFLIAQYGLLNTLSKKTGKIFYRKLAILGLVLAVLLLVYIIFSAFFLVG